MLADRASLLAGYGRPLEEGLKIEADAGLATLEVAMKGAQRFADGAGRGGSGV
jgi:hypothetical protein